MASIVNSFAISGVEGYLVDVEVKKIFGQPIISIVGLGDTAIKEALLVSGINVFGFDSLVEVAEFLKGRREYNPSTNIPIIEKENKDDEYKVDFKDVQGQDAMIEYVVVAAARYHNLIMIGAPGWLRE